MAKSLNVNVDLKAWFEDASKQFRNLDTKDPSSWPALPRYAVLLAIVVVCVTLLWFLWLSDIEAELTAEQAKEVQLREEFKTKLAKAVNLEALRKQREQVQQYVIQLEKQVAQQS
jgi:type IV pilus assembly protein PilO